MVDRKKVIVIGSGLSAYGSIVAALTSKVKITVLDIGEILPSQIISSVTKIREGEQGNLQSSLANLSRQSNQLQLSGRELPKKTLFGSHYFYKEQTLSDLNKLPFSQAFGGYSVAWGGAVLFPSESDLPNDFLNYDELVQSIKSLAPFLPLPNFEDALTPHFPNYGDMNVKVKLKLSDSQKFLLHRLSSIQRFGDENTFLAGQSRLLTETSGSRGCQYCGMCSHGCIFNSIFSSEREIKSLVLNNSIEYLPNRRVIEVREDNAKVIIETLNTNNNLTEVFEADYVFVAAGAVNSTKIAIKSFGLGQENVRFQKTGGFVRPYFSLRKIGFDWPHQNTQANVFMEIKNLKLSKYWIHSQVSTPNEIIILGLGFLNSARLQRLLSPFRSFFLKHLVVVMTNLHSSGGPFYELSAESVDDNVTFNGVLTIPKSYRLFEKKVEVMIRRKLRRIGLFAIPFTRKGVTNGPGYHIGGSMPIGGGGKFGTDDLGRFSESSRISFVDTSVLPCIPATTIGLFSMTNAHRITTKVLDQLK